MIETFWPLAVDQSHETDRLGACIARARHLVERRWGLATLEIPQSWICDLESFHWLTAHLLARLLRREDLEGGLLVSRVFGGVKLGVGGVSRAFREAGEGAIEELRRGVSPGP